MQRATLLTAGLVISVGACSGAPANKQTTGWLSCSPANGKGLVPENPSYDGDGVMLAISW